MAHVTAARLRGQEVPRGSAQKPNGRQSPSDQSIRQKRRKKSRRPKLPRMSLETRFTIAGLPSGIVREIDTPAGPRIDLAFFSLPLVKGGAR